MKPLVVTVLLLFPASALVVQDGKSIDDVAVAMQTAGYPKTALAIGVFEGEQALMWTVDEGVLMVSYSIETQAVSSVSFWIMDERPKASRKVFTFSVKRFDTTSVEMVVATKKPK